jgi:hypothetical protein
VSFVVHQANASMKMFTPRSKFKQSEVDQIIKTSELVGSLKSELTQEGIPTDSSFLSDFRGEFVNTLRESISAWLLVFDPDGFAYLDKVPLAMSLTTLSINGQKSCFIYVKKPLAT